MPIFSAKDAWPEYEKAIREMHAMTTREARLEAALRRLLDWRGAVNQNAAAILKGIDDPDGVAVAIMNGPIWDDAEKAIR